MWLYKPKLPKFQLVSASLIDRGEKETQHDAIGNVDHNCFLLSDGRDDVAYSEKISELVVSSVIELYKINKKKPTHLKDKKYFLQSLFKTAHRAVVSFQKKNVLEPYLASATLTLAFFTERYCYIGNCGDSRAFMFQGLKGTWVTPLDTDSQGGLTQSVGGKTFPSPFIKLFELERNDVIFLTSDGISNWVTENELESLCFSVSEKNISPEEMLNRLSVQVKELGCKDTLSAWVIVCQ